jgi:hypothetical protein
LWRCDMITITDRADLLGLANANNSSSGHSV